MYDSTNEEDRFRYIDDLEICDLVILARILYEYDFMSHTPSDIGVLPKILKTPRYKSSRTLCTELDCTELHEEKNIPKVTTW